MFKDLGDLGVLSSRACVKEYLHIASCVFCQQLWDQRSLQPLGRISTNAALAAAKHGA